MNPPCAKCKKSVYPMEKLTCLDKTWHKACFRCEECNLLLSMKTYKGYSKLPYCNTHYPTTRFTAVADTPENKRLAQQSKQQSELEYRKDKEAAMREFTQVSDNVSTRQAQQQQRLASNIGYQSAPSQQAKAGHDNPPPSFQSHGPPAHGPPAHGPPAHGPPAHGPSAHGPPPQIPPSQPISAAPPPPSGPRYFAVYDYTAADDDEVSFNEGDELTEVTVIDEGWMEGRVVRTGDYGMLPSNYLEKR